MTEPIRIRVCEVQFYMRNVRTRMPFRYGKACVLYAPILHVRMSLESETGEHGIGVSADLLPPKWFDKDPGKDFERNVADLLFAARTAAEVCRNLSEDRFWTPFELWRQVHCRVLVRCDEAGLNPLTANHGSSLMERAVIEAVGLLELLPFHELVSRNRLGIEPGEIHAELADVNWIETFSRPPLDHLHVRHTVGLSDPILTSDLSSADRLNDGLPQSLEEYIEHYGLRYFKVKVCGSVEEDLPRLRCIAELLDRAIEEEYFVSLDGNEQFTSVADFLEVVVPLTRDRLFQRFYGSVLYIEQPFERGIALEPKVCAALDNLTRHRPVIIDESDSELDSFKEAAWLGYQGVSAKNCKGIYKSLLNRLLVEQLNQTNNPDESFRRPIGRTSRAQTTGCHYFMTGEDLMNAPVVPLHQDVTTLSVLGITHAERNGYHYFRGLDHLTERERRGCLASHAGMYNPFGESGQLRIVNGVVDIRSLHTPGMGVGMETDFDSMVPLHQWEFASLGESNA